MKAGSNRQPGIEGHCQRSLSKEGSAVRQQRHAGSWITSGMGRVWRGLEKTIISLGTVAAVCILILMILTTLDVVLRYILNRPLKGALEISEILFLAAVFLGMAYTQLFREHVNADLLVSRLSKRTSLVLETVMFLPALLIYGLLTWQGTLAFWDSFITGEYRWGLIRIPLWEARLMVPLGTFFLCLRLLGELVINFRKLLHWEKGMT